jgi:hypothetical protein
MSAGFRWTWRGKRSHPGEQGGRQVRRHRVPGLTGSGSSTLGGANLAISAYSAVVIISVPIAFLVLVAQRRIVSGLTAGSFR